MGADGSRSPTNLQHVHATARWLSPFYGGLRGRFPWFAPMRLPFTSKIVEHSRYLPVRRENNSHLNLALLVYCN